MKYENIQIGTSLDGDNTVVYISDRLVHITADDKKIILTYDEAKKLADLINDTI